MSLKQRLVDCGDAQYQVRELNGVPVVRPRNAESSAWGAAGLAGLAVGYWENEDELAAQWALDRRFEPHWSQDRREARIARWRQAVELSKGWASSKPAAAAT